MDIVSLVRISKLVRYGLIGLVVGIGMVGYGLFHQLPAEAELQTVVGKAEKGTKVTTRRRRAGGESVNYKLEVRNEKGEMIEISLPASEITEAQALTVLNARQMSAKYDAENDVYVLNADGRTILDYATTRKRREGSDATLANLGGMLAGAGLLLGLIGWAWTSRAIARQGEAA